MSMVKDSQFSRSVSIYDVARRAGVSAVTVSRVWSGKAIVSESTRLKVLQSARELGYKRNPLAAALRGASSHTVGILWSGSSSSSISELSRSLQRGLEKREYVAMTMDHFHEWKRTIALLEEMRSRSIDAIIIQAQEYLITHPRVAALLDERPCVVVSQLPFDTKYDLIVHDRIQAYRQVIDHFISTGRKRLLFVTQLAAGTWKFEAIKQLLKERGKNPDSLGVLDTTKHAELSNADATWRTLCDQYPDGTRKRFDFDAVICESDTRSVVIQQWLCKRGLLVPDDVAVVGSHNEAFSAYHNPPLATLENRHDELATTIERVLFERFENPDQEPIRALVSMNFVPRESAG